MNSSRFENDQPIIFDCEIFDTEENYDKNFCQQSMKISKFNKKNFILKKKPKPKTLAEKRPSLDQSNRSLKKVKLQLKNNDEEQLIKSEICSSEISNTNNDEMIKLS